MSEILLAGTTGLEPAVLLDRQSSALAARRRPQALVFEGMLRVEHPLSVRLTCSRR